MRRNIIISN
ncbi:Protein PsiE, partial [Haemophilus influenzae]